MMSPALTPTPQPPYPPVGRFPGLQVRSCGLTDIGHLRRRNEDCLGLDDRLGVYVVADGIGGLPSGDLASRMAVETIHETLAHSRRRRPEQLEHAVQEAHERIREAMEEDPSLFGMGTTVVSLLVDGGFAELVHAGDSRVYRLRGGKLAPLTRDHNLFSEVVGDGLSPQELAEHPFAKHPLSNSLSRALGVHERLRLERTSVAILAGDVFLLCSDGLTTMLDDDKILTCLVSADGLRDACERLVEAALEAGGYDNVTVALVEAGAGDVG